jgi:hypothetical protein
MDVNVDNSDSNDNSDTTGKRSRVEDIKKIVRVCNYAHLQCSYWVIVNLVVIADGKL